MLSRVVEIGSVPSIASVRAEQGCKTLGRLTIAKSLDGSLIEMPFAIIKGTRDEPKMWVEGALHADECAGSQAIRRIISDLKPEELSGTVIAIPIVNTSAFSAHMRFSPIDNKDLNLSFTGNSSGTFTERFASLLFKEITSVLTDDDFMFDLHGCPGSELTIEPWVAYQETGGAGRKSKAAAEATGIRVVYKVVPSEAYTGSFGQSTDFADEHVPKGRFATEMLRQMEIGRLVVEAGGSASTEADVKIHYDSILNVMKHLGMLKESAAAAVKERVYVNDTRRAMAKNRGFWRPMTQVGRMVSKGQVLSVVTDEYGRSTEEIVAPVDGILLINRLNSYVDPLSGILSQRYGAFVGMLGT